MPTSPVAAVQDQGLQAVDYLVVAVYLLSVLAVGLYFSTKQTKSEEYFIGGRKMPWLAVGLSIMVTTGTLRNPPVVIKRRISDSGVCS